LGILTLCVTPEADDEFDVRRVGIISEKRNVGFCSIKLVTKITLSTEEKDILQRYFETSPIKLILLKAQAIVMRSSGIKFNRADLF